METVKELRAEIQREGEKKGMDMEEIKGIHLKMRSKKQKKIHNKRGRKDHDRKTRHIRVEPSPRVQLPGGTNVKERKQRADTHGDISCVTEHSDASAASLLQH